MIEILLNSPFLGPCISTIIPLLFIAIMVKDEKSRKIVLFFCWGTFTGLLSHIGNTLLAPDPEQVNRVAISIAPIFEEVLKALPLLLFLNKKKYQNITIIIVYSAISSGIGYSIQESIFYFSNNLNGNFATTLVTLIMRTISTALMHGVTTSIIGAGIFITQKQRHIMVPVCFGLLALAATIHSMYNVLMTTNFKPLGMMMPIVIYIAGLMFLDTLEKENK